MQQQKYVGVWLSVRKVEVDVGIWLDMGFSLVVVVGGGGVGGWG